MGDICRLCCSTKFVNNDIFDEASALYLKMSLYLPIKIFNNDQLPQKICDKCSCKVNDFYQFCSEVIEVEHRLRSLLLSKTELNNDLVDLTIVKGSTSPLPTKVLHCHKSTQTDNTYVFSYSVQVKEEPNAAPLSPVKEENTFPDQMDAFEDRSSDSEDMSLINLKNKKAKKISVNGDVGDKKTKNKKVGLVKLENLMNSLPGGTELSVHHTKDLTEFPLDAVKVEMGIDENSQKEVDVYHCCICFMKCYNRNEMLQHYRVHVKEPSASEPPSAPPPPDQEPLRCTRCRKVRPGAPGGSWRHTATVWSY